MTVQLDVRDTAEEDSLGLRGEMTGEGMRAWRAHLAFLSMVLKDCTETKLSGWETGRVTL